MDPRIMQALQALGGGSGGPGGAPPGMPGAGGPPMGGPMGAPPPGLGRPPGAPPSPLGKLGQEGMDALNGMMNRPPSGELRVERTREGMELVHKIILQLAAMTGTDNMELSKNLFTVGRQIADMRLNLSKENEAGIPPEAMLGSISGTGLPGRV